MAWQSFSGMTSSDLWLLSGPVWKEKKFKSFDQGSEVWTSTFKAWRQRVYRAIVYIYMHVTQWNLRDRAFLSINRFERKKNLSLALQAFALFRTTGYSVDKKATRLIFAGGFDERIRDDVEHLKELKRCANILLLTRREPVTYEALNEPLRKGSLYFRSPIGCELFTMRERRTKG